MLISPIGILVASNAGNVVLEEYAYFDGNVRDGTIASGALAEGEILGVE